jgi:hypothetical protein
MQDLALFTPRTSAVRPPLRSGGPSTRFLNRFEYTSFWGSYVPGVCRIRKKILRKWPGSFVVANEINVVLELSNVCTIIYKLSDTNVLYNSNLFIYRNVAM